MTFDAIVEGVGKPYWAVCGIIPLWILKDSACRNAILAVDTAPDCGASLFRSAAPAHRKAISKAPNTWPSGLGGAHLTTPGRASK